MMIKFAALTFLSSFFGFVGMVFCIGLLAVIAFPYSDIKVKIASICRNICFIFITFVLAYGLSYVESDEIVTKPDAPVEYTIVKGQTEKHVSTDTTVMVTYYAFGIDTNNVFSFYYPEGDNLYKKASLVMDDNFYIKEINEDKCYIQIQDTQHYMVYKSKILGTVEENIGKDTVVYLYVPAGTLSSAGEIILD